MRKEKTEMWSGYAFLLPAVLAIVILALFPTLKTFFMSFRKVSLIFRIDKFNGLVNYSKLLADHHFWNALKNTMIFTVATVFFEALFGLCIALVINKNFKGRGLVRASVLVPWAIPTVVTSLMWKWVYNTDYGIFNYLLMQMHLIQDHVNWLGNGTLAMICVIMADVWKTTPFIALLSLAGLQTIPNELYESAKIDGAGVWKSFMLITMPLISKTLLIAVLLRTLDAFRVFDLIFVLTNGGPGDSTSVLSTYAYKILFSTGNFGYGSTLAVSVFLSVGLLAVIYLFFLSKVERRWG